MSSLSAADRAAPLPSWRAFAIMAAVALAVLTPELVMGLTVTDNFRFNLLWPEQFADLFRGGHLYPRWLPSSWQGLGSPNFYFYPPLFFWVTAVIDTATAGMLPAERFVEWNAALGKAPLGAMGLAERGALPGVGLANASAPQSGPYD